MHVKLLILGAGGMLGHMLWLRLRAEGGVVGTLRSPVPALAAHAGPGRRLVDGVDARHPEQIDQLLQREAPQVLINCVGLIKQLPEGQSAEACIQLNSLLPHQLDRMCRKHSCRLIQISTDCVFSGSRGSYTELDTPDATDVYGRSKALGEVVDSSALTIRTSIIGPELKQGLSLVEWFLAQTGTVRGFAGVLYNGLTTLELANLIQDHILPRPELQGLYQAASKAIDKDSLLRLLAKAYRRDTRIERVEEPRSDKTLVAEKLRDATGYTAPSWEAMLAAMRKLHMELADIYPAAP